MEINEVFQENKIKINFYEFIEVLGRLVDYFNIP